MKNTEKARIILCRPAESRNIGSVCRAMKNMAIKELTIVGKKEDYNEEQVSILSVHAQDVWNNARFCSTLEEAVADCVWTAGTTRRRGKNRKEWLLLPEDFIQRCNQISQGPIGIVFGNERTGLTDEELAKCNAGLTIPANGRDGSLNLSHAVQIICYELFRSSSTLSQGYTPITNLRLDKTVNTVSDNLQKMGFFKIAGKEDMELFWKSILSRAALSESEAVYIEKTFSKAAGLFSKKQSQER